ncbi:MAG: sulfotransferase domain-containing protein [Acidobacteria bacterium]|nr:sulfotransferase domain-containing protein [Acidobacteriota bacterium]MCA1639789.1 sulfotransferase domain-containing protein [Acidobacteriota bacterium]
MKRLNYSIGLANDKSNLNLYSTVQQEVDLGVQALKRESADMAVTLFQSAIQKLTVEQPFYDHLVHNLLLSYKLLIEQLFNAGDIDSANNFLRAALNLEIRGEMAEDSDFRKRFAGAFQDLGLVFFKNMHYEASVLCCRKAISIYSSPSSHVNLTNSLAMSGQRADLADFTTDIIREQLGTHIFIACVPKSASTFLKNLLVSLTGYRDVFMVYAAGQNEHELYLPTLRETAHLDTVTQQHCRASDANVQMMQAFDIKPVVLVRNIFDSVMSLLDFHDKGAFNSSYFRADYQSLDEETKIDLLIDNVIPWYFQFVASWSLVEKQKSLDIFWLGYEDLIADKPSTIQNILKFYGLGAARRGIEQKIKETESEGRKIRFNKGVKGRGESRLSESQKERIRRFAKYHPGTDFSRIGL